ncbi:hypothetical protein LHFGNBLO_004269 [Mesorhizobium sp. AR10]|uniref:hypothetical protein n=1 Tax=Mesorhizobium sp. AR10 TaxID=2865839 RepID=UPI00216104DE|nr:hypothetical protein [Mesorhizobium sp. AR10]UVK37262.1 hypothetical protein LHFGNBLO_004269 [Mesorhizobium sp. AR10]
MKADILSFPKAPGRCGSGVHERGRLASARDQQKWNPVLRVIARQIKVLRDQQKVESGFASGWCGAAYACVIVSAGVMRRRASGSFDPLERHRTASIKMPYP